jgi:hypothetical protein
VSVSLVSARLHKCVAFAPSLKSSEAEHIGLCEWDAKSGAPAASILAKGRKVCVAGEQRIHRQFVHSLSLVFLGLTTPPPHAASSCLGEMPNNKRISPLPFPTTVVAAAVAQSTAGLQRSPPVSLKIACRADKVKMYDWLPEIRYFFTNRVCIRRSERRSRTNLLPLALESSVCDVGARVPSTPTKQNSLLRVGGGCVNCAPRRHVQSSFCATRRGKFKQKRNLQAACRINEEEK